MEETKEEKLTCDEVNYIEDTADFCHLCQQPRCYWKEYENEMKYFGESLQGQTTEEGKELSDGEKRFRMYQQIVYYINSGPMGKGNRMELSMCVVESIRNLFPGKAR